MILKLILGGLAAIVLVIGGYAAVKEHGLRTLATAFDANLASGDYLAALAAAGKLKETGATDSDLNERINSAARLLVAEDALAKAKRAADEKRFADAGALLRGSTALTDPAFKYYEEAQKLYKEVEARAAGVAHQTAVTISALENQAAAAKNATAAAEKQTAELSNTLKTQSATIQAATQELQNKQEALKQEQARTEALKAQVEIESRQKFFNEFKTYRDLAEKGREQLESAVSEINAKRDVTALVYLSQGKILFEEAKNKTGDLRSSRTPTAYQSQVDNLVNALAQFLESAKQLRNAVVFIEDQGSAEFTTGFDKGKSSLANAVSLLDSVSSFIASNL